jgi:hypothetical protein
MGLKEDLEQRQKELRAKSQQVETTPVIEVKSPLQRISDADLEISAFKKEQELDSVKAGYASLILREKTIADREKTIADKETNILTQIGLFEVEQKKRMETYNTKVEDYNKAFALLQTERKESSRIMQEAIKIKSEAETIIKSQTELEKTCQEKQEAYVANMDESVKLMGSIFKVLRKQDDGKLLSLAGLISKDLNLIQYLQFKKCALQTIADVVSVDIDRITEVCGYLQDSKKDYSQVLKYLLDATDWLQKNLKIDWTPAEG